MASIKIFVVLALLAAASAESETRIVGGSHTTIEEFPHIVAMVYYYPGIGITIQRCVGTLLSSWHILSTSFCFTGAVINNMQIRAGSTSSLSGGTLVNIDRVVKDPNYVEKPRTADVAVVFINRALGMSNTVNIVYLPAQGSYIPDGTAMRVVSWGFEYPGGPQLQTLKTVELNKVNNDECALIYNDTDMAAITDTVICATAEGRGMCDGDSGASMTLEQVVLGIFSHHVDCNPNQYPDLFTRIDRKTNWILEVATSRGQRSANHIPAPLVKQL